jgi:hypothetical protein
MERRWTFFDTCCLLCWCHCLFRVSEARRPIFTMLRCTSMNKKVSLVQSVAYSVKYRRQYWNRSLSLPRLRQMFLVECAISCCLINVLKMNRNGNPLLTVIRLTTDRLFCLVIGAVSLSSVRQSINQTTNQLASNQLIWNQIGSVFVSKPCID